jgi:DNA-directed RNA polymerase sigma subunit (sigma70/sigma32)
MPPTEPSDAEVEQFIAAHPHGGTLEEIGALLGISKQRATQLERAALAKVRRRMAARGFADWEPPELSSVWDC